MTKIFYTHYYTNKYYHCYLGIYYVFVHKDLGTYFVEFLSEKKGNTTLVNTISQPCCQQ